MLLSCCVCLKTETQLIKITENDEDNLSWSSKLSTCVPEVDWNQDYSICSSCTVPLRSSSEFRALCLKSDASRADQLARNLETCLPESDADSTDQTEDDKPHPCPHCSGTFHSEADLSEHVDSSHSKKPRKRKPRVTEFPCEHCDTVCKTSKTLVEHALGAHGKTVKPFRCDKCGARFASSSNLVQHTKYHDGLRDNICTYCGKGFITSSDLINHEKQHLNRREYQCKHCPRTFNTHKDVRSHTVIKHRDPSTWNYRCSLCDRRFHIKPNYDSHMRRHAGDRPFSCHLCPKGFVTKHELGKHVGSHSNVRAFRCGECGREYKDKRVLAVHLARAHGVGGAKVPVRVRRHLCTVCPKAFYYKSKLARHLCTHSGERPYGCEVCERRFTDRSYVKQHMRVVHGVGDAGG